ncbi:hypothetical protein [Steroidobacter cummioxidans]|nr:hypothetical protein [Steroidobacter cummioxidans]
MEFTYVVDNREVDLRVAQTLNQLVELVSTRLMSIPARSASAMAVLMSGD